jgi:hypothetical protein
VAQPASAAQVAAVGRLGATATRPNRSSTRERLGVPIRALPVPAATLPAHPPWQRPTSRAAGIARRSKTAL